MKKRITLFAISIFLILGTLTAQNDYPYPSLSPKGQITQVLGNTNLRIEYERPSARKRKVFGALVPWNKVWRTGAGHCTKISFDRMLKIGGQQVEAGTYSLFTIPNPEEWTVILNKDTTLYGSYNYQDKEDVARFTVIPQVSSRFYESLNFDVDLIPNNARVYLSWENTQIQFDIETSTDDDILQYIEQELISGKSNNSDLYAGATEYLFYQNTNLKQALILADKALAINKENGWARDLKVRIFERLKLYDQALLEIEAAIKIIENASYENEAARTQEIGAFKKRAQSIQQKNK